MKYCTKCWMPDTRPRITFDENGVCNACQWSEKKKTINWGERQQYFKALCDKHKKCIVPWSGGKDSIYVAYKMRDFGLDVTLMTVLPHLETKIGKYNRLQMCPGFKRVLVVLDEGKYRSLAKKYFIEKGRPKHPWETAISAVVISKAAELGIPFIIYGEEGEAEYGGVTTEEDRWKYPVSKEYLMNYYYQGDLDWKMPELDGTFFTQWSRFENWSPSMHTKFAVAKGMRTPKRSIGTFTNTSQLSDKLQDLHTYLMYIKFGFGRCTADVCIAIREGLLTREKGKILIDKYDGEYPWKYHKDYLDYFGMTDEEFWQTVNKFGKDRCTETKVSSV